MKKSEENSLIECLQVLLDTKSVDRCRRLADLFFTYEERETLASRWIILKLLMEDKLTQREIAAKLGVSISQITRGSNALKIIDDDLRKFLLKEVHSSSQR